MPKRRRRWLDYSVYLLVRVFVCVVQSVSWGTALGGARRVARIVHHFDKRHRDIAAENLRYAFPQHSPDEIDALVLASYEHLAMAGVEIMRMPRTLSPTNYGDYVRCPPDVRARFDEWWKFERPLVVVTGHFGNWEIIGYATGLMGFTANVIARKLDNPYLDRWVTALRESTGVKMLDKNTDFDGIQRTLETGGSLGVVGDQDAGSKGLFVNFFGRPASTFKSIALLSLEYNAAILVVGMARTGHPLQYQLYLEDEILPEDYARDPDAIRSITERYSTALERMIRRYPEQYLWMHRRWKHQPKVRAKKAA